MQEVEQSPKPASHGSPAARLPVTVIIPVRNEAHNLPRCLRALGNMGEVIVVDSQSTDATVEIAREFGAHLIGGVRERREQRPGARVAQSGPAQEPEAGASKQAEENCNNRLSLPQA